MRDLLAILVLVIEVYHYRLRNYSTEHAEGVELII